MASQELLSMRSSLFDEGIIDEYFAELEKLEDQEDPNFVEETVTLYFRESKKTIADIEQALDETDIYVWRLDKRLHQLKGSSASVAAKKVKNSIDLVRESIYQENFKRAKAAFQLVKQENENFKLKLESYFQLKRQSQVKDSADAMNSIDEPK